jgi:hypothetical protein
MTITNLLHEKAVMSGRLAAVAVVAAEASLSDDPSLSDWEQGYNAAMDFVLGLLSGEEEL